MRRFRYAVGATVLSILALAVGAEAASQAPPRGALKQLSGTAGCIAPAGAGNGCATGKALNESSSTAISPDGKNVYVAATEDTSTGGFGGVEVLARNRVTGKVHQLPGKSGCVTTDGTDDSGTVGACAKGNGLSRASYVVVSHDGKNVYVASSDDNAVAVFDRNPKTGALTQPKRSAGCVAESGGPSVCAHSARDFSDVHALAISADGRHLYMVAGEGGANSDGGIEVFSRNAKGRLSVVSGKSGCVSESGRNGTGGHCAKARMLFEPYQVAFSSDGKQLYVAASEGDPTGDGGVVTLDVRHSGLRQPAGAAGCLNPSAKDETAVPGSCAKGKAMHDTNGIGVSPDGRSVYVSSAGDGDLGHPGALDVLARNRTTGTVRQLPGKKGCLSVDGTDGFHGTPGVCAKAREILETYRVIVSPDGAFVYVTSQGLFDALATDPGGVSVFKRHADGSLSQLQGANGCVSNKTGNDGQGGTTCAHGRALQGAYQLALSPGCANAYVAVQGETTLRGALAVFSRRPCAKPRRT